MKKWVVFLVVISTSVAMVKAGILAPSSDGSDGVLNITSNTQLDLSLATPGEWDMPGSGNGVYDTNKWLIVFKYQSVNINSSRTLTFKNHPSRAPVMWLVQSNVTINGSVSLVGSSASGLYPEPGPGGFRGRDHGSKGFGPYSGWRPRNFFSGTLCKLIGGGGGGPGGSGALAIACDNITVDGAIDCSGRYDYYAPSAAAGALIIAASGSAALTGGRYNINVRGQDSNRGGTDCGYVFVAAGTSILLDGGAYIDASSSVSSGRQGTIRLMAPTVNIQGYLRATGGDGTGGIYIECDNLQHHPVDNWASPTALLGSPSDIPLLMLEDDVPYLRCTSLGGLPVPEQPIADVHGPLVVTPSNTVMAAADIPRTLTGINPLIIEARHVPTNAAVTVFVKRAANSGEATYAASFVSGNVTNSTWQANVDLAGGVSVISARASFEKE